MVSVDDNSITNEHLQSLDDGRGGLELARPPAGQDAAQAGRAGPPDLQSLRRPPRSDRAQAGQGPAQADGRDAQGRSANSSTRRSSSRCSAYLISSDWVLGEASDRGVKVSDKEVKKQFNQIKKPAVPQGSRLPEVPDQHRLDGLGPAASREAQHALLEDPAEGHQGSGKKPTQKEIAAYYEQHKSQYGQPEKRNILIDPHQDSRLRPKRPRKKSNRARASRASPRASRSTRSARPLVDRSPGVVKGQEEKALDTAVFAPS